MKVENVRNDLISRKALLDEMMKVSLDNPAAILAWIEASQLIVDTPAVPNRAEKFVRCDECDYCKWSEESGMYLCSDVQGMNGELDPKGGDGCSHGRR